MGICRDPRLTYLNDKGYNVLRLPRQGIEPLDVVGRDGKSVDKLGTLSQIWSSAARTPTARPLDDAVDLSGQATEAIKLSIGVDILATILKGMGAASADVGFAYQRARSVRFQFTSVKVTGIDPLDIGNYLAAGDLKTGNPFARYFRGEEAEAFVISEVLKSDAIVVEATADSSAGLKLDLPAIQGALGASVDVSPVAASTSKLEYKSRDGKLLTFGFKLYGITFVNGSWMVHGVAPSAKTAFAPSVESPVMLPENELATLSRSSGRV